VVITGSLEANPLSTRIAVVLQIAELLLESARRTWEPGR